MLFCSLKMFPPKTPVPVVLITNKTLKNNNTSPCGILITSQSPADCHSCLRQDRAALSVSNPSDRIFKGDDSLRSGMLLVVSVELSTDW